MNEINCIYCNTYSDNTVIEENGFTAKKCPSCSLIYLSPRPSFDEIVDIYSQDDAHLSADSHISNDYPQRLYAKHRLRLLRRYVKSGAILEIGAGVGSFLDESRKMGFNPYGLELNPLQADYITNNLNIPCKNSLLSTSVFDGKKFDIVYHCDVISHFYDPIAEFTKTNKIMNDNSFLIFETGNLGEIDTKYFKHILGFQLPDHLFFFSTDNLIQLLEKTGFKTIKMFRYSILPQLWAYKMLSKLRTKLGENVQKSNGMNSHSISKTKEPYQSGVSTNAVRAKNSLKNFLKKSIQYVIYLFRYKIGRIFPKANRPQTVIIIAQK